jgi:hypothetical protein
MLDSERSEIELPLKHASTRKLLEIPSYLSRRRSLLKRESQNILRKTQTYQAAKLHPKRKNDSQQPLDLIRRMKTLKSKKCQNKCLRDILEYSEKYIKEFDKKPAQYLDSEAGEEKSEHNNSFPAVSLRSLYHSNSHHSEHENHPHSQHKPTESSKSKHSTNTLIKPPSNTPHSQGNSPTFLTNNPKSHHQYHRHHSHVNYLYY